MEERRGEERRGEEVWNGASKAAEVESSAGEVKPNDGYNGDAQCTRCVGELGTSVEDVEATMAENNTLKLGRVPVISAVTSLGVHGLPDAKPHVAKQLKATEHSVMYLRNTWIDVTNGEVGCVERPMTDTCRYWDGAGGDGHVSP
jgi:hypothetical protein